MHTTLFPIQEAANSECSLAPTSTVSIANPLVAAYAVSESQYRDELQILSSIVRSFDPVYDNYYDDSLDDVTNEMVAVRKQRNNQFLHIVTSLREKHIELSRIFLYTMEELLVGFAKWALDINTFYESYLEYYKLDLNQCKSEIKIRRRPLVRIKHLLNFTTSLKLLVAQSTPQHYTPELISDLEIITYKLSKTLQESNNLDANEREKCELHVNIIHAKDIVQLKPICVDVSSSIFSGAAIIADVHYVNNLEQTSLSFMNMEVYIASEKFCMVERDTLGKSLLFAPLRRNEFTLIDKDKLLFHHTIHSDIQLCFSIRGDPSLADILIDYFPSKTDSYQYSTPSFGLGFQDAEIKTPQSQSPAHSRTSSVESTEPLELNTSNIPLYKLKFASSSPAIATSLHPVQYIQDRPQMDRETELSKSFLTSIANDEDSDDEDNDAESIISDTTEPVLEMPVTKKIDFSKYKPSAVTKEQKIKKKNIFSSFSSLFKKQKQEPNLSKTAHPQIVRKSSIPDFLSNPQTRELPNANVCVWNSMSWTKPEDVRIRLHEQDESHYLEVKMRFPLLLQLNELTKCAVHAIDIHLTSKDHDGRKHTILIRPSNRRDLDLLSKVISHPEIGIVESFSVESELSKITRISNTESDKTGNSDITQNETKEMSWTGVGNLNQIRNGKLIDLNRCVMTITNRSGEIDLDFTGFEFGAIDLKTQAAKFNKLSELEISVDDYIVTFDDLKDLQQFNECVFVLG